MAYQRHRHKHARTGAHNWKRDGMNARCRRCGATRTANLRQANPAPDVSPFRYFLPDSKAEYGKRPACLRKPANVQPRKWRPGDKRARGARLLSKEEKLWNSGALPTHNYKATIATAALLDPLPVTSVKAEVVGNVLRITSTSVVHSAAEWSVGAVGTEK